MLILFQRNKAVAMWLIYSPGVKTSVAGQVGRMEAFPLIEILPSFHFPPSTLCSTHAPFTVMQSITFFFSSYWHTHTHTYVHTHRWPDAEYVNRHLLQYPISSPHHVSDMLMQPTQFLNSTTPTPPPPPTHPLSLCFLSTSLPRMSRWGRDGGKKEGGRERGREKERGASNKTW